MDQYLFYYDHGFFGSATWTGHIRVATLCSLLPGPQLEDWNGWVTQTLGAEASASTSKMASSGTHWAPLWGKWESWFQLCACVWPVFMCGLSNVMVSGSWMCPRAGLPRAPSGCMASSDLASDVHCIISVTSESHARPDSRRRARDPTFWWRSSRVILKNSM